MKDLNQIILNPIRSRIIQYLALNKTATAGEVALFMTDVPRTTLYRHLNILAKNNLISVVEEKRVRGTMERTYALNLKTFSEENTNEKAIRNAFGFLMKIYEDFAIYFNEENANPEVDKVFLSNISLILSDEEFNEFIAELNTLLRKHLNNQPNENRKQRSMSFISSPVIKERICENEKKE